MPSRKEYKCEDVLGSGRNPNGIGNGNRSGGTTWWIGVRLSGRGAWRDMWDDAWTHGRSSGFPGQQLLFAYTQSTPALPPFLLSFLHSLLLDAARPHTSVFHVELAYPRTTCTPCQPAVTLMRAHHSHGIQLSSSQEVHGCALNARSLKGHTETMIAVNDNACMR